MSRDVCARCGNTAEGYAAIGGKRFCHSEIRRCYEDESWDLTRPSSPWVWPANDEVSTPPAPPATTENQA